MTTQAVLQMAREAAAKHASNSIGMGNLPDRIRTGEFDFHESVKCFIDLAQSIATPPTTDAGVHATHCGQGEYAGSCKYGDADCPTLRGPTTDPSERMREALESVCDWLEDDRIGTYQYMESSGFYEDLRTNVVAARAALTPTNNEVSDEG